MRTVHVQRSGPAGVMLHLILALVVGLAGCGGGGDGTSAPAESPAPAAISADGGKVEATGVATVIVPPGALDVQTTIRVANDSTGAPPVPAWFTPVGAMVAITPHGAVFNEPVTVRLPAPQTTLVEGERLLIAKAQPGGTWEVFADTEQHGDYLEVKVRSLSVFTTVIVRPTRLQPAQPAAPFAFGPMSLSCDGRPCGATERLRAMTMTATTSGNGGELPAGCSNPEIEFNGGLYANSSMPGDVIGTTAPIDGTGAFERSFQMPTQAVISFPPVRPLSLLVFASLICTDSATGAKSRLTGPYVILPVDQFATGPSTPVVREFPPSLSATPGQSVMLKAVLSGGASYLQLSSGTFAEPNGSGQAIVHIERQRAGESTWTSVLDVPESFSNPSPYGGTRWMYWGFELPLNTLLGSSISMADNGTGFRLRACVPTSSTQSDCNIGPVARLTVLQQTQLPAFTAQPRSVLIQPGQTASFTAQVNGVPAPTLQWQMRASGSNGNWSDVPANGTAANYTTAPIALADNGVQYRLVATNSAGSVASDIVSVSVNTALVPPAIGTQPSSLNVVRGSEALFAVNATGTEALSYQWFKGRAQIDGANAPQLKISNVTEADFGSYWVEVRNAAGVVGSAGATLTVSAAVPPVVAPAIVTQPAAVAVTEGNVATFAVGLTGSGPMSFQWRKNGNDIVGATAAAYTIAAVTMADAGNYSVVVRNAAGNVTSQNATLAIAPAANTPTATAPVIVVPPSGLVVSPGMSGYFGVTAQGSGPLSYRWFRNGVEVSGQTGAVYEITAASSLDAGAYRVEVSNSAGTATSGVSQVLLLGAPAITSQPSASSRSEGATATFSVGASGDYLRYQWLRNNVAIAGADSSSFTTPALMLADSGAVYSVIVYNGAGIVFSQSAALTVTAVVVQPPLSTTPVGKLALGAAHGCAVKADYTVACWGMNNQGQLGNGSTSNASTPTTVSGLTQVIAVAAGSRGFYSTHWGQSCAVQASGGLWCWGRDVNAVDQLVPQAITGATDARAVAVGAGHACYLDGAGQARCWGFNISGELANGTFGNPQPVPGLVLLNGSTMGGIVAIGAGDSWSCALRGDGTVWCWGVDHTGNAEFNPQPVADLSGATALSMGANHACALVSAGAVRCWGFGRNGELGDGDSATSVASVPVTGLIGATAIAAGQSLFGGPGHTCALRSTGSVVCWGTANLGNGMVIASAPSTPVTGLSNVNAVAAGQGATCVLQTDGTVACWGTNTYGQLGVGDTNDRNTPTAIAAGSVFWHP